MPTVPTNDSEREFAGWEHFSHSADIGVRAWGPTIERAFEEAAAALTGIVTNAEVMPSQEVTVACNAPDLELLLVAWLNVIIYEMAVRRMVFSRFAVRTDGARHLRGSMWGEPIDMLRHAPAVEPKGATVTALRVEREPNGLWTAACVVDV